MKIKLIVIGKTDDAEVQRLIEKYENRLKHYVSFQIEVIPDLKNRKNLSEEQQKNAEGKLILEKVQSTDITILLDERGKQYSSIGFAQEMQKHFNSGAKQLNFIIGGPFGFSQEVYQFTNRKLSLSQMTFSHQMIRCFFVEQIYRAMTILHNENYHHE